MYGVTIVIALRLLSLAFLQMLSNMFKYQISFLKQLKDMFKKSVKVNIYCYILHWLYMQHTYISYKQYWWDRQT